MSKKKSNYKAKVVIEKKKDGTFDIQYHIKDPENLKEEEFIKLVEFVEEALSGTWEGF